MSGAGTGSVGDGGGGRAACAVVTGAASGIGRGIVELFLDRGYCVVAADLNEEAGARLLHDLDGDDVRSRVRFVATDTSVEADVERAVRTGVEAFGRVDVMVNNAGIDGAFGRITELDVADWDHTYAVLVRGVFLGIKHAARQMQSDGLGGCIVNTASPAGEMGGLGRLCYSSAKAAVHSVTRMAAVELAPSRIRVNAVNPGLVQTPLIQRLDLSPGSELDRAIPWPEYGKPDDVARVVHFLCGPDSGYVTGVTVNVDGGLVAAGARLSFTRPPDVPGMSYGTTGRDRVEHLTAPDRRAEGDTSW